MEAKIKETMEAIDLFLNDAEVFNTILDTVFASIDSDKSGTIELTEISKFIESINKKMSLNMPSSTSLIQEVFHEMDKDKSNSIDKKELGIFLRVLLTQQKKKLKEKIDKDLSVPTKPKVDPADTKKPKKEASDTKKPKKESSAKKAK